MRDELGMGSDEFVVVHVGNIRPNKGHRTLLEAATVLLPRRPDVRILSIGGEKNPGDLAALCAAAIDLGIGDRLEFLGRRYDAVRFIAACDV